MKGRPKNEVVMDVKVGAPILIRQEKVGDRWQTWVAVFSAQQVEEMVKEGR